MMKDGPDDLGSDEGFFFFEVIVGEDVVGVVSVEFLFEGCVLSEGFF